MLGRAGISTTSAELYLARMQTKMMIFVIEERSYELSLSEWHATSYDCAVSRAPPVHMIKLLQEREITRADYPEEYGGKLER